MIELENLNDELKEHLIFDEEYKYHYINYPYYQFRLFFISSFTIDETKMDDYLKEYCLKNNIKLEGLEPTEKTFDYLNHNLYSNTTETRSALLN